MPSSGWLSDPLVAKLATALLGVGALILLVRLTQGSLIRRLDDPDSRYYGRKLVSLSGYAVGIVFLSLVFKDRLGGLTVAIGVASAGIAFALQEVIGSVAGWIAISFGGFYKPGDRVQLGGIKGDVIDIGILRTTLMELGEWVASDLYTGRIVRIANSFVFKAAGVQLFRRLPLPLGRDPPAREIRQRSQRSPPPARAGGCRSGRRRYHHLSPGRLERDGA